MGRNDTDGVRLIEHWSLLLTTAVVLLLLSFGARWISGRAKRRE